MADKCPKCGTEMHWLAGAQAHQDNQYCPQKACGHEAWDQEPKMTNILQRDTTQQSLLDGVEPDNTATWPAIIYLQRELRRMALEPTGVDKGEKE
jgi:hypothetical protein